MKWLCLALVLFLSSCTTLSINIIKTSGSATDLVDEQQTQSPSTTANPVINIPTSLIP